MNKTLLVLRHEIFTLTSRPSFWIMLFAMPVVGFLLYGGVTLLGRDQGSPDPLAIVEEQLTPPEEEVYIYRGVIDEAGLLKEFPPDFPREVWEENWEVYDDLTEGLGDLDIGFLDRLYVIPADYLDSGQVEVYAWKVSPFSASADFAPLRALIQYNLIGDEALAAAVADPLVDVEFVSLAPPEEPERDQTSLLTLLLPYGMMMLLFVSIFGSSSLMLNSVAGEKENRIMEVLLNSISAREMLVGKMIGLGLVGFLQVAVWAVSSYILLRLSGQSFALPVDQLPEPSILIWAGIFFILGYLLYASLMAGVGALVPNLREASQATMLVTLPMLAPFFLVSPLIENPSGAVAMFFSMFPFTAPEVMVLRLAASRPPIWQPLLSAALMVATLLLCVRLAARLFRAQTIMTGQSGSLKRIFKAIAGRD